MIRDLSNLMSSLTRHLAEGNEGTYPPKDDEVRLTKRFVERTAIVVGENVLRVPEAISFIDSIKVKSGLSTRVVQSLGGWEQLSMVERYTKSLSFDDALKLYKSVNFNS